MIYQKVSEAQGKKITPQEDKVEYLNVESLKVEIENLRQEVIEREKIIAEKEKDLQEFNKIGVKVAEIKEEIIKWKYHIQKLG